MDSAGLLQDVSSARITLVERKPTSNFIGAQNLTSLESVITNDLPHLPHVAWQIMAHSLLNP
jgi:hypothetical protein